MTYKEGECFKCGKKDIVGSLCDDCAKKQKEEEDKEEEFNYDEEKLDYQDYNPDDDEVAQAEAQENFQN